MKWVLSNVKGLLMIFHESDESDAIVPNYPVHGENAVNVGGTDLLVAVGRQEHTPIQTR
ncbi:hypothetical protein [Paenibacillus sedimenti]|uniref:Uncharacterized protein n=1 Tax=Paenibacillus sedimenti TaxID=2770274 RepID=A0A926KUH8_9BACL|nr:hypothetical protein [Paenibacillus sedimenti]MBD0384379.1 hypothetical protein [Paenibacillus sedimenti]